MSPSLVMTEPRGWNRPVRPVALVLVGGAVLLIWLVMMAVSVWYFYQRWEAVINLSHQPVRLRLPPGLEASVDLFSPVRTHIDVQPHLRIPVRQSVPVQLPREVQARVRVQAVLPLDTRVVVDQVLPVKTSVSTTVSLLSWLPRVPVTIPVDVNLPVHIDMPLKLDVPVDLDVSAKGELPAVHMVFVNAMFDVRPRVSFDVTPRVISKTSFTLLAPLDPIPMEIVQARLHVPFDLTFLKQRP